MTISIKDASGTPVEFKWFNFPGGEVQVRLETIVHTASAQIRADLHSSNDILLLLMATDALRREGAEFIYLRMPYLPYARQDRECVPGEALGARVMCDLINQQGYEEVEVWDVHSHVSSALLNRMRHVPASAFVRKIATPNMVIVAPDRGATERARQCALATGCALVQADKIRNPLDGSIKGTEVYSDHIGDLDFLMVDDICDGGKTFIELAKKLRPLTNGKVHLYVTHGIFSRGFDVFEGLIDDIYCANVFPGTADHVHLVSSPAR